MDKLSIKQRPPLTIMGIDVGTATTGWGVITKNGNILKMRDYGIIATDKALELPQRLVEIYQNLSELLQEFEPDFVAVESIFFAKNQTTVISVSEARGVILLALEQYHARIKEFTPMQVKKSVAGYGKADKKQVQQMVKVLLKLEDIPKPDDAADGLALCIALAGTLDLDTH
jgi:crossover junction endodeoxyribonuclease RuvC